MKPIFPLLTLGLAALAAQAAEPSDGPLRQCRSVADAAARLACYDALPLASTSLPQADASPAPAALLPAAAFGLESRRSAVQEVSSTLPGLFEGWERNTRFKLANGQVWQISDDSSASYYLHDPKVTVRRAALGSFRLEIDGVNQAPRVQRVE
jgi:hypothetical protein